MVNNLLYYQSNYFALFLSCLSLVTFLYPGSVLLGSVITVASVAAFHKFSTDKVSLRKNSRSFCYSILVWVWSTQEKASRSICGRTRCHCYILLVLIELESVWTIFFTFGKIQAFMKLSKTSKSVTTFLLGVLFPILLVLVHSALRLRNAKNKVTNHLEKIGVKKTPMGVLLSEFGQADISIMWLQNLPILSNFSCSIYSSRIIFEICDSGNKFQIDARPSDAAASGVPAPGLPSPNSSNVSARGTTGHPGYEPTTCPTGRQASPTPGHAVRLSKNKACEAEETRWSTFTPISSRSSSWESR